MKLIPLTRNHGWDGDLADPATGPADILRGRRGPVSHFQIANEGERSTYDSYDVKGGFRLLRGWRLRFTFGAVRTRKP